MELFQFFGRLHPLVLHLPIGFLALAFIMEWASRKEKYANLAPAVGFALFLGMWSAIGAAISGYVLSLEGGYDEKMLSDHQWVGIATAAFSVIIYFLHQRKNTGSGQKYFFPAFAGLMALIGITGHLGGGLTHGSDFLTEPFTADAQKDQVAISNMDSAFVFQDLVQPILKKKCVSCHNESKIKGDLLLTTTEGILKGGKIGPFFMAGDIAASLFLQRVHLPLTEKEHMPPKGKQQLNEDEIDLLEWWVAEGGDFKKQVADLKQPEDIKTILAKYNQPDESVYGLSIDPASASTINKLRKAGIEVEVLAKDEGFLAASLRGQKEVTKSMLKKLNSISDQLIHLDLSETNVDDQMLSYLKNFPHLQKIFLQKTQVNGSNLSSLSDLKYLEYLNLYDTPLKDEAIEQVVDLANLKTLYLWKTKIKPENIAQLRKDRPTLHINTGVDESIFGTATLKPPKIIVESAIFKDSIKVEFKISFRNVQIFYTIDGSDPDSTSTLYTEPFYVHKTSNIKVISKKDGWGTSSPAEEMVIRGKYQVASIQLNKKPSGRYKGEGAPTLTNFKKGTSDFAAGEWLGYEKSSFTATLDLGKEKEVTQVTISALESANSWIFFPKELKVSTSTDGRNFQSMSKESIPIASAPEPTKIKNFSLPFDKQNARYVKVEVKSNLVNPAWHQGAGKPCWIFVDEILNVPSNTILRKKGHSTFKTQLLQHPQKKGSPLARAPLKG